MSRRPRRRPGATFVKPRARPLEKDQPAKRNRRLRPPRHPGHALRHHRQALAGALRRMLKTPLATFMTIMVIAVALSLPAALQLLVKNAQQIGGNIEHKAQLSLFLHQRVTEGQARELQERLAQRSEILAVEFISRQQALEEFRAQSEFGAALDTLGENPLPHVLLVYPRVDDLDPERLEILRADLAALPQVEIAQLDLAWLQRLFAIVEILQRSVAFISLFLTFAVILVVANTIRLMSQNYRDEIEVFKLVGASDAYVRRPFLYSGLFYGAAGSLLALLFVWLATLWLSGPVNELARLYHSDYQLQGLSWDDALTLLTTGMLLGFGGSWAAASRYIKELHL